MCGGIVGSSRAPYSIIYACYNRGRVSGASYVGGLVGFSGLSMSGCYSVGVVVGGDYTGNISGYASSSNTRCYFIPQIGSTTAAAVGGGSGGNTSVSDIETLNGYVDTINDANYSDSDVQSVFPITYSSIYYIKGTDTSTDLPTVVGR